MKLAKELVETREDGRIKLYLIYRGLTYRREKKELFVEGTYIPLESIGSKKDHVCAFARKHGDQVAVVAVPRLLTRLIHAPEELPLGNRVWEDSALIVPDGQVGQKYYNIFSGETVKTAKKSRKVILPLDLVFTNFPVALMERNK